MTSAAAGIGPLNRVDGAQTPVLLVVIGSTRPTRVGPSLAKWFVDVALDRADFNVELVDLKELNLPLFDEPQHPRLGQYAHEHTRRWSRVVARSDAVVLVHPEYNHGMNAALKNAIDYLSVEWRNKPVGLVSYGGVTGGVRASEMLKVGVNAVGAHPITSSVIVPFVENFLTVNGSFEPNSAINKSAQTVLDELSTLGRALAPLIRPNSIP